MPYREIRHGDIVVFLSPAEHGLFVVKRIIGIPGDRIHLRDDAVYRNGQKLDELYVQHKGDPNDPDNEERRAYRANFPAVAPSGRDNLAADWQVELPSHIEGEDIVVPPNSYFAMGDNRDVSYDSRYWGFVPRADIVGKPFLVYFSLNDTSSTPGPSSAAALAGDGMVHHESPADALVDFARWDRAMRVIY